MGGRMVIEFGDWQLRPYDKLNWQLWHRHPTVDCAGSRKAGTVGEVAWFPCGRYYSASTIPHALVYAADCEVRNMDEDAVYEIRDVLEAYKRIVDGFTESILRCLSVPQRRD